MASSGFMDIWCMHSSFACFMVFSPLKFEICSFRGFLDVDSLFVSTKLLRVRHLDASVYPINVSRNIRLGA